MTISALPDWMQEAFLNHEAAPGEIFVTGSATQNDEGFICTSRSVLCCVSGGIPQVIPINRLTALQFDAPGWLSGGGLILKYQDERARDRESVVTVGKHFVENAAEAYNAMQQFIATAMTPAKTEVAFAPDTQLNIAVEKRRQTCPRCNNDLVPGGKFCPQCGEPTT